MSHRTVLERVADARLPGVFLMLMKNPRFLTCLLALCLLSSTSPQVLGQIPPQVASQNPPAGSLLLDLSQINVIFNSLVVGVEASDLRINGSPATSIITNNPNDFTFIFPPQPDGPVNVEWIDGHGITDRNEPPTPFAGGQWSYAVNSVIAEDKNFIISEFLANNQIGIVDDDADRSDWIEISNRGNLPATLDGWFLTDSASNLGKWRFPDGLSPIASKGFLLVWASSKDRTNIAAPLHTNFRLSSSPSFLALVNPQSNIVSFFSPYPTQQRDISYGRDVNNPTITGFFTIPTPGRTNSTSGAGFAPQVLISLDSGVFTNQSISLTMSAPSGVIRYTTNGSIPLTNSPVYTTPLTFSGSAILKARVFPAQGSGLLPGPVEARNYVLLETNVVNFTSKLPILVMSTSGRPIGPDVVSGSPRVEGTFLVMDTGLNGRSSFSGQPEFLGNAGYEIFGQTSSGFSKPPYRIEVHDAMGEDLDIPLLGLPAEADWKLRNPFNDKTVMNDFLAYELFDLMGNYSPRRRYVEVFVDTGGGKLRYPQDYLGVMFLFESIKAGKNRVDIKRLGPLDTTEPDISGGYIFKKDKPSPNDLDFTTVGGSNLGFPGQALKLHEPRPIELRTAPSSTRLTPSGSNQLGSLVRYLNRMERALYTNNWLSLTGTNHYSHYLDIDSFVDFHWLVEFTKQIDGVRLSTYFHKDRGGKVKAGPVWDWNLSFGNADYLRGGQTNGWYYAEEDQGMSANEHIWLRRLINGSPNMGTLLADGSGNGPGPGGDPDFNQKIADRWGILRTNLFNATNLWGRIDKISSFLDESVARDLWGKYRAEVVGVDLWPNPDGTGDGRDVDFAKPLFYRGTTANSIIGQMKKWVHGRYLWIDGQFTRPPSLSAPGGRVTPGTTVTLTPATGTVLYYTLDGSDPRQPGGMVASGVMSNTSPVTLTIDENTWVFARAYRTGSWYRTWSPPESASYITSIPGLRLTELMYHPAAPGLADTNSPEAFEFVEIANLGATSISLGGSRIRGEVSFMFPPITLTPGVPNRIPLAWNGVSFMFPPITLTPASRVVVVANTNAFRQRYPDPAIVVAGQYEGSLNNARGRIVFTGPAGESIHDFEYSDDWGKTTDGFGFSLVIRSENTSLEDWGHSSSWRAGSTVNGTPGRAEPAGGSVVEVVVNEASTRSEDPAGDQVELHNPTSQPANISGWFLSDDPKTPFKYRIPDGTIIAPGGYWTVAESAYGIGLQGFSLSSMGDDIYLFAANAAGNLLGYSHGFQFGAQLPGQSFGRLVLPNQGEEF
ncbi:MAG: hypothetical protein FJ405_14190, partial [Verrucomicrobia bacterium]|nr:hypothetical protein [Verrucomicrobiota bacterium]